MKFYYYKFLGMGSILVSESPKCAWKLQKQCFFKQNGWGNVNLQGRVGNPIFWLAGGSPSPTTKENHAVLMHINYAYFCEVKSILAVVSMILHLTNKNTKLQKTQLNSESDTYIARFNSKKHATNSLKWLIYLKTFLRVIFFVLITIWSYIKNN